jgi:colicin import membrane protein
MAAMTEPAGSRRRPGPAAAANASGGGIPPEPMPLAPLRRPRPPAARRGQSAPSFVMAMVMHGLLFAGMWLTVQWHTVPEAPAAAELWGALPPLAPTAEPTPAPPVPAPTPPPPPPPVPEVKEPDIVEKQEKKAPEKKAEEPKKEEPKRDDLKAEAERIKREEQKRAKDAEQRRAQEIARLTGQVDSGLPTQAGGRPGGADPSYAALVKSLIKGNLIFSVPEGTSTDVSAEVIVDLLPSGEIAGVRITKASGLAGFDEAVERAIQRTNPFPRKKDGSVDRTITLVLRPAEPR